MGSLQTGKLLKYLIKQQSSNVKTSRKTNIEVFDVFDEKPC